MCSIIGIYKFKKDILEEDFSLISKGLSALKRRGPDEDSFMQVASNCILAGNRLIIRGSKGVGSMPFEYRGNICYYNGEIYNYGDWIEGADSDGEVILPVFEKYGLTAFCQFDGEFSISIWDDKKDRLILARDPFGTKPLYFRLDEEKLVWGSSERSISQIDSNPLREAKKGPVYKHTYCVQEPYTSYDKVWSIPPGHFMVVEKNSLTLCCYNKWEETRYDKTDTNLLFDCLEKTMTSRLDYDGVIGIPMSGGIDSGIIAFMADKLNIKYHIFSVVEMFGEETVESPYIYERLSKLKNANDVTLLKCGSNELNNALLDIFKLGYYDSERLGTDCITMHTVMKAMRKANIRVTVEGSGGDELFHGYEYRDDFVPIGGWPMNWRDHGYYYSIFSSLLAYTSKTDRAGAFFSIESRFPFQSLKLMRLASQMTIKSTLKWPLRKFLLENTKYGLPNKCDLNEKYGFSIKNVEKSKIINVIKKAWLSENNLKSLPRLQPTVYPFKIGQNESKIQL